MNYKLCQLDYTVGDLQGNTQKIIDLINEEKGSKTTNILIFSELAISGYPPLDLLDKKRFIQDQLKYVDKVVAATKDIPALVVFGYIEENKGTGRDLYNSALVCRKGEILFNYRKRLLPTYDVFDEARYFEPGKEMGLFSFKGKRIGILICEDLWYDSKLYDTNPAQELFNAQADVVLSLNASPSVEGKYEERISMLCGISKRYNLPIVYCNQTGGNDDIVFDGNSVIINERGILIAHALGFDEDVLSVPVTATERHAPEYHCGIDPLFYTNPAKFFTKQAVCGIGSYLKKCGFKSVVIGESGGIDSAVVTALAAMAIGPENVYAITMPSQYSSEGSYGDSQALCDNFGIKLYTYPINDAFNAILTPFNEIFPEKKPALMEENLQARIRGQLLMSFSNRYGCLVLSTGNKSELSVGFCTIGGDMMGGLAPISDIYKMEVYAVARYINKFYGKEMIPQVIIDKEPSAELAPDQIDTDSLPPYPVLDAILKILIEGEVLPSDELDKCKIICAEHRDDVIKIRGLLKRAEFKRRQAAITLKMHHKAFGYGRRIPIAQKWNGAY